MDLIVAKVLQQSAGDLRETEPFLLFHVQRDDRLPIDVHGADLQSISMGRGVSCLSACMQLSGGQSPLDVPKELRLLNIL